MGYAIVINSTETGLNLNKTVNSSRISIEDLKPFSTYEYKVAAFTIAGIGPFSTSKLLQTLQDGIMIYIHNNYN